MKSRNHPDRVDDPLLESARRILTHEQNTHFTVKPWREIMSKNVAKESKAKEVKAAAKMVASRVAPYKHEATETDQEAAGEAGVDSAPAGVVHSGFSAFNPTTQGTIMTEPTAPKTQADREAEARAKIAAKQARLDAAAKKKADAEADKAEKARLKEEARAKREQERAAAAEQRRQEREAAAAQAAAEGKPVRERNYEGSMLALSERTKAGVYVKGANGQLRSTDEVAVALEVVPAAKMVDLLLKVLGLPVNPYSSLNYGQQSMNLRNRLRGAIRKASKVGDTDEVITVQRIIDIRDNGGYVMEPPKPKAAAEPAAEPATEPAAEAAEAAEA